jgi:hypothetical protein
MMSSRLIFSARDRFGSAVHHHTSNASATAVAPATMTAPIA